jgi:hypothetical protein
VRAARCNGVLPCEFWARPRVLFEPAPSSNSVRAGTPALKADAKCRGRLLKWLEACTAAGWAASKSLRTPGGKTGVWAVTVMLR